MPKPNTEAAQQFWRIMRWIAVAALVMVLAALTYLRLSDGLTFHMVIATVAGVSVSVLLGCGLFALAFFSDKSGHDARVDAATKSARDIDPP